mgnify:CR=1 FL=1
MTFQQLGILPEIISAIQRLGFESPTPVQEQVIPFLLNEERDLVALAQTGTGKTAGFGLPVLTMLDPKRDATQCLVLAPTRELCMQIASDLRAYAACLDTRIVAVYGGEDIRVQLRQLDSVPHIIVATPGRLIDLLHRSKVNLEHIRYLILDEADEMLDMGFKDDIESILTQTPDTRRTLLFSATMPPDIADMAKQYMHDAHEITIGRRNAGSDNVDHIYYVCRATQRYLVLKRIVDMNPDIYGIVFCRTREETKEVAEKLMKDGYNADTLHGDLNQAQRDTVMRMFRQHAIQLLVATDVAARGLDVNSLTHVINYNLPDDIEVYTHRSGRTGRINKRGISVSIIHSREKHRIRTIERMLKRQFTQEPIPSGMDVCRKQLFHLINRMQHVDVDNEQIDTYMPEIDAMLESIDRETLIKRFVSLEFNRFLDYYRKMCEERLKTPDSNGNWGNWHSCLKHLEVYCDEATTFDDIDAEWIQGFKDYLNTAEKDAQKKTDPKISYVFVGLSQNSKVSYFNKLRACLNQAFEEHIIDKNPMRGIEGFKAEEVAREYLTLEEVKKMAATPCNYPILKATFLFSCLTGLRKSDIEKLTWGEIQKFGDFTRIVFKQKKTGGQEYLDISDQAAAYLGTRRNDVDRVFEGFTYGAWTSLELKRWALAAGITKNLTFHCARHTFAVMMLDLGADIYTVSKLLGHRELSTTQIYAKVLDKNKQAAVNLIPSISE